MAPAPPPPREQPKTTEGFTHTVIRLRPAPETQRKGNEGTAMVMHDDDEPDEVEAFERPTVVKPVRSGVNIKRIFCVLCIVLLVVGVFWILGDMLVKRMALRLLFQGSNLPLPPKPTPVKKTVPETSILGGSQGLDLYRDVRPLNNKY